MLTPVRGTEGYAEDAAVLRGRYEEVIFSDVHAPVLRLMPQAPCCVLDIGAGTGRDAAALAELGNIITAVEPVDELRAAASALHPSPKITWIKDSLPDLAVVAAMNRQYDLVMLTAVWMHLDAEERERAMPVIAALMHDGGTMLMSLRHGPSNPNRRIFEASGGETVALGRRGGLDCVLCRNSASVGMLNRAAGVTWTHLAFVKVGARP
jgi:protein-L-isoaspartate O-methyltransferase